MTQRNSTIIGTSLIGMAVGLQANPLLAHTGHSNKVESQDKQQTTDNQPPSPEPAKSEETPQMSSDEESTVDSLKTTKEQPTLTESETTQIPHIQETTSQSILTVPVPVMGESLLALLVASPFLLFALKRWFHK